MPNKTAGPGYDDVQRIIQRGLEDICEKLDELERRHGVTPKQVLDALRQQGESEILDFYEDWLKEGDAYPEDSHPSTMGEVPDPGNAESYKPLDEHLKNMEAVRAQKTPPVAWPDKPQEEK